MNDNADCRLYEWNQVNHLYSNQECLYFIITWSSVNVDGRIKINVKSEESTGIRFKDWTQQ